MVDLVPMSESDFQNFMAWSKPNYIQEMLRAGNWQPENAEQRAEQAFKQLLPKGMDTPNQYFYCIYDEARQNHLGYIWFGTREGGTTPFVALYDIVIFEAFRGQGYGRQTMQELEVQTRALGLNKIALHVFGHNHTARSLYKKAGYVETDVTMVKVLEEE